MKKNFLAFLIVFACFGFNSEFFSQKYQIKSAEFDVEGSGFAFLGKTKPYSILTNFPLDTKTVFESAEDLEDWILNYKKTLENSRNFQSVEIFYEQNDETFSEEDVNRIVLKIKIKDSHHFLIVPYPKYSSNTGISLKLKEKDSNFMGTLQPFSSQFLFEFSDNAGLAKQSAEKTFLFGFALDYDYPFKLGIFDAKWVNDYSVSYTTGKSMPEWNLKTGLKLNLPFNKNSLLLELYQYSYKNFDYAIFHDDLYFTEEIALSAPVSIFAFENYTNLYFTPKILFYHNWDFDGINVDNDNLSSPSIKFSNSLSNQKIDWNECLRSGYSATFEASFTYNMQRNDFSPYLGAELKLFHDFQITDKIDFFERFGIASDVYMFSYFFIPGNSYFYGEQIGGRLRGILDKSFFGNDSPEYTASTAFVINLDLPFHLFTTNFKKLATFNFNMQISPFFDAALVLNRKENTFFSVKDGYYCAGLEILVYPLKWSNYTLRASVGFDLKNVLKSDSLLRGLLKYNEIFIGIGLQY